MYARVASFEGRDASLTDELVKRVRDQGPVSVPDSKGFLGLFDREHGTALGISFFDSEEAIRNSQRAFEDMAQNFPAEMRGRRTSVDVYEVTIFDGDTERAQAARVSTLKGSRMSASARVSSSRRTRRTSLRTTSGCTACFRSCARSSPASTRSRRSTR